MMRARKTFPEIMQSLPLGWRSFAMRNGGVLRQYAAEPPDPRWTSHPMLNFTLLFYGAPVDGAPFGFSIVPRHEAKRLKATKRRAVYTPQAGDHDALSGMARLAAIQDEIMPAFDVINERQFLDWWVEDPSDIPEDVENFMRNMRTEAVLDIANDRLAAASKRARSGPPPITLTPNGDRFEVSIPSVAHIFPRIRLVPVEYPTDYWSIVLRIGDDDTDYGIDHNDTLDEYDEGNASTLEEADPKLVLKAIRSLLAAQTDAELDIYTRAGIGRDVVDPALSADAKDVVRLLVEDSEFRELSDKGASKMERLAKGAYKALNTLAVSGAIPRGRGVADLYGQLLKAYT